MSLAAECSPQRTGACKSLAGQICRTRRHAWVWHLTCCRVGGREGYILYQEAHLLAHAGSSLLGRGRHLNVHQLDMIPVRVCVDTMCAASQVCQVCGCVQPWVCGCVCSHQGMSRVHDCQLAESDLALCTACHAVLVTSEARAADLLALMFVAVGCVFARLAFLQFVPVFACCR